MERNKILQVLVPAGAAAAVIVLIGVLIAMSDWGGGSSAAPGKGPGGADDLSAFPHFSLTGPEWKPVDEAQKPGLKYWEVKEGTGEPTPQGATVTVKYSGWLVNGTPFDSGQITYPLRQLVPGWQAGIPGMKTGGIRRLLIPSQFGYGPAGSGDKIPPNATLVFEVEMISFR